MVRRGCDNETGPDGKPTLRFCGFLIEIDATRAPLHPLILQGWLKGFGSSDYSGRTFSVLCGVMTVGVVYWIGLQALAASTGLLAAWLCALSPLLVYDRARRACICGWF